MRVFYFMEKKEIKTLTDSFSSVWDHAPALRIDVVRRYAL